MTLFRVNAPAKINLSLHITGKRADGYHLLESLVAFTDFGDVLRLSSADAVTFQMQGAFATQLLNEDNIVLRAARMLQEKAGISEGVHIALEKNIPVGAGLGGGSADAAATLRGLNELWNLRLKLDELSQLALHLGSDVPVCLQSRSSWITGVGEHVNPASLPDIWLVLVNPRLPLLTAQVYHAFNGDLSDVTKLPNTWCGIEDMISFLKAQHNALERPAISLLPVIQDVIAVIAATPECLLARMSGSGATCFGIYQTEHLAQQALLTIQAKHPDWWLQLTRLPCREQDV